MARPATPGRRSRRVIETRLVVVEGYGEKALLEHVRTISNIRGEGFTVSIRCAKGGSPSSVVQYIFNQPDVSAFDRRVVMYDTDRLDDTEESSVRKLIRGTPIEVITSAPNLDELLLRTLGFKVPSSGAKVAIEQQLGGRLEERRTYEKSLTMDHLIDARGREPSIDQILKIFDR